MYISWEEKQRLETYCIQHRPYTYVNRITYNNLPENQNYNEDYLGVGVYPTLYSSTCSRDECNKGTGLYYSDIYIIRSPCEEVCKSYLYNQNYKNFKPVIQSSGIHTLFIVKEIANIVLNYTDLQFEIRNAKLLNIYKSRKGFGNRIAKVSSNTTDYRYRVLRKLA